MRAGRGARAVQRLGERGVEDVVDQRALAGAGDAGDGGERAERNADVDVLEVVVAGADDFEEGDRGQDTGDRACRLSFRLLLFVSLSPVPCPLHPAVRRHRDRLLAAQVRPGDAAALFGDVRGRAVGDDLAAESAGAGAEVEEVVGACDHLAVVLDDHQRVAQVAELLERVEQPRVVARVQADRRLVEHVEHAAQAAADLAGQADALGLAAGERRAASGRA